MAEQLIDRMAMAVATRGSRRRFLSGTLAAAGALIASKSIGLAGGACASDAECDGDFTCQNGFCQAPGCTPDGMTCTAHVECCEGRTCQNGTCAVSPRCSTEGPTCGTGCCPGLICTANGCEIEPPAPPEETGGGNNGGGNNGGGGTSNGDGGTSGGGTTTSGVSVSSLPSTGAAPGAQANVSAGAGAVIAALGLAGIASRLRRAKRPTEG